VSESAGSFKLSEHARLAVVAGDIARVVADAIVNAANERMLGGSGVDGASHAAAGYELYEVCRTFPEIEPEVSCPRGEARKIPGFRLPAGYVIHTVGPWYESREVSAPRLDRCCESSLRLANEHGKRSIAFPAIS